MYSYEIENLLKLKSYLISVEEYFKICDSSQVINIKYFKDNTFEVWTNDNYYFKFKVLKRSY